MNIPHTITELQEGLKEKKFSAVEVVENYLSRIKVFDKDLNSFLTVTEDYALKKAQDIDRYIADNGESVFDEKPLLGSVVALKDIYSTNGIRTTAASKVLESYVPAYSATVVNRLEEAGAIIIGKTNCDAWAHGASGENSDFGPTCNPWNKQHVPGGSSSGSAVSVSANFSTFSMGTDTGGSIRQPASFCNVVGLKPTYGRVPRYGVIAMASSLDTMGHFTRSVEDSRRILNVTTGSDGKDSTVANNNYKSSNHKKIGVPKEYFSEGLNPEIEKAVLQSIEVFKNQGYEIVEISLPHTKYALSVYYIVQPAEVSSNLGRFDGIRFGNDRSTFGSEAKRRIMLGTYVLSSGYYDAYYLKAMKVRSKLIQDFDKAFEEVDAIITPTSPIPPFKIGEKVEDPLAMYLADVYTVAINLVGIPGLSLNSGFTESGLPIGFQILGPKFSEDKLFDLGELYQKNTDHHTKTPNL